LQALALVTSPRFRVATNKQNVFRELKLLNLYSICEVSLPGKQVLKKIPKANKWRIKHILDFIHKNNPFNIKSLGSLLFHHFIDDLS
jgi:hypothetical protein